MRINSHQRRKSNPSKYQKMAFEADFGLKNIFLNN